jgi:2-polyprenyl-3-methyl-5-hydroxy-6-metoxy-1,4-benzoquinol methylase/uncharacterized protein YbaR (Trm112 family)
LNNSLIDLLACPRDGESLAVNGGHLLCARGHHYPIVDGIPVLLRDDVEQTGWWSHQSLAKAGASAAGTTSPETSNPAGTERASVRKHVQEAIAATCGNLYSRLIGKLEVYPIPRIRLPEGAGKTLLDIGCNWGRWSIAASRKGYQVIGMDPNLDAVLAAREVARQLGAACGFIVGDARYLPFRRGSLDVIFSYSVIQHFSKQDVRRTLVCIAAALEGNGYCLIQMPNKFGVRSAYHLARRGFSEGANFDVRYWSPQELKRTFEEIIGPTQLSVDGFFGLGIQPSDIALLPARYRIIVRASEVLRGCSGRLPFLLNVADSLYVKSRL